MYEVEELVVSPDKKWLAVVSVGEGHPALEVVDAQTLLLQRKYIPVHAIDPYPGTVSVTKWEGDSLLVTSDMPLHLSEGSRLDPELMVLEQQEFRLFVGSWHVEPKDWDKLPRDWRTPNTPLERALLRQLLPRSSRSGRE
ncbi:MAG TPA: hypothetical protein VFB89_11660 [Gemmatimonadales bacterium]|nr:hypothetical protein [Gemmatimonadales bacterium]